MKDERIRVGWLAPNLNHYRVPLLNELNSRPNLCLTVLAGTGAADLGHKPGETSPNFTLQIARAGKKQFGFSMEVMRAIFALSRNCDWIMVPAEKKYFLLFLYVVILRCFRSRLKIFTYCHPLTRSGEGVSSIFDEILSKIFFSTFDKTIFYTKSAMTSALVSDHIKQEKAGWANNTLSSLQVKNNYVFSVNLKADPALLFIGRLIENKKLDLSLKYFDAISLALPGLIYHVIGNGPEAYKVEERTRDSSKARVVWHGALTKEIDIAKIMTQASCVFVAGHSGLSVNHAFMYGRPYITIASKDHPPEVSYIKNGHNGYVLSDGFDENVATIVEFLTNTDLRHAMSVNAFQSGEELSSEYWAERVHGELSEYQA